jgi:hypothetical protein
MSDLTTLKSIEKVLLSIKARLVLPEDKTKLERINDILDEMQKRMRGTH